MYIGKWALGGRRAGTILSEVEKYNPVKQQWEQVRPLFFSRADFGAAVKGKCIYLVGGLLSSDAIDGAVTLGYVDCYDVVENIIRRVLFKDGCAQLH
ncbi:kelch repeat protein [Ancylostoma duodenale]|uniref:Kelch repeat protein n=1 Tax=Ancylostoma duodenale TaxID=51022 RepID=A0A0C2GS27_9BILA|nr:kelch repeat protein [Ancylostoma duodenale]